MFNSFPCGQTVFLTDAEPANANQDLEDVDGL